MIDWDFIKANKKVTYHILVLSLIGFFGLLLMMLGSFIGLLAATSASALIVMTVHTYKTERS